MSWGKGEGPADNTARKYWAGKMTWVKSAQAERIWSVLQAKESKKSPNGERTNSSSSNEQQPGRPISGWGAGTRTVSHASKSDGLFTELHLHYALKVLCSGMALGCSELQEVWIQTWPSRSLSV